MKMNKKTHFGYKEVDKKDKEVHVGNVFSSVAGSYDICLLYTSPSPRDH